MESALKFLELAPDGFVIADREGRIAFVNMQALKLFGYTRDELLGQPVEVLIPERFHAGHVAHRADYAGLPRTRPMGVGLELYGRRKDGTEFPVEISLSPVETPDGMLVTTAIRDITDRKLAEEQIRRLNQELEERVIERTAELTRSAIALRESEARFKAFMNHTAAVAWMKDEGGRYAYINEAFERRFQVKLDGVQDKTDFELFPADVAKQLHEHDLAVLAADEAQELQEAVPTPDGSMHHWLVFKFPFRDASGRRFVGGMAFDVTEKVMLEQQVRQAEKLAAIGQLTAGLAHEIGTPLSVIGGRAEYMLRKMAADDPLRTNLERIIGQIERITKIVNQLLSFTRTRPLELRPVAVPALVREVLALVEHPLKEHRIVVKVDCGAALPEVPADPDQLQQVLLNLIMNAIQAMPGGGALTIRAARTVPRRQREDPLDDRYVKIEIADQGAGIPPEHLPKIFDPFFTTKEVGKGTGLGLAVSNSIAHKHGGWLRVQSRVGEGSVFSLYLPLQPDPAKDETGAGRHG
ncbi:MAG: PAS domain S-box protein [Nitrospirota bacterium]